MTKDVNVKIEFIDSFGHCFDTAVVKLSEIETIKKSLPKKLKPNDEWTAVGVRWNEANKWREFYCN
jgi:hypothetical protein